MLGPNLWISTNEQRTTIDLFLENMIFPLVSKTSFCLLTLNLRFRSNSMLFSQKCGFKFKEDFVIALKVNTAQLLSRQQP